MVDSSLRFRSVTVVFSCFWLEIDSFSSSVIGKQMFEKGDAAMLTSEDGVVEDGE